MKPTNPAAGAEAVLTAAEEHESIESAKENDRATAAVQDALARLDALESTVRKFHVFFTETAQVNLQAAISELQKEAPDYDHAHKSASAALDWIDGLRVMIPCDGEVMLCTNNAGTAP